MEYKGRSILLQHLTGDTHYQVDAEGEFKDGKYKIKIILSPTIKITKAKRRHDGIEIEAENV